MVVYQVVLAVSVSHVELVGVSEVPVFVVVVLVVVQACWCLTW